MEKLLEIMERLLGPGGCPWDQEQTVQSLRKYMEEESQEVLAAVDSGDEKNLCEELGDLLFNVLFMARVAPSFGIRDVIDTLEKKLIRRHPHVFGDVSVSSIEEAKAEWERIKLAEG